MTANAQWLKKMTNGTLGGHAKVASPVSHPRVKQYPNPPKLTPTIVLGAAVAEVHYPLTRQTVSWQTKASNPSTVVLLAGITEYDYDGAGNVLGYRLPPNTYNGGSASVRALNPSFWFFERAPGGTFVPGTSLRTLEIEIRRISDNVLTHYWVQEEVHQRDDVVGNPGPLDVITEPVTTIASPSVLRMFATFHTQVGTAQTFSGVSISWEMWLWLLMSS